jgi:hypothetical protein
VGRGVAGVAGGIAGLRRFLREHGGAVERDLFCAGRSLDDLGTSRLTWRELLVFVEHAPTDSAIGRAAIVRGPDDWITPEIQMLRELEHKIRVLAWMQTADAALQNPQNYPERLPLTVAEKEAAKAKEPLMLAPLSLEDMTQWLGERWTTPAKEE